MSWDIAADQYIIDNLVNQTGSAEGSNLPPRQQGEFRVPFVTNLQCIKTESYFGGTQFTLRWIEPSDADLFVDHYNVWVTGLLTNNFQPLGPYATKRSPAQIRVSTNVEARVTFYVQTVLTSGMCSDILSSATCTGITIAAEASNSDIPDGTISRAKIANNTAGALDGYDSSGVATVLAPGATGALVVSTGVASLPSWLSPGTAGAILASAGSTTPAYTNVSHLKWDSAVPRIQLLSGQQWKRTTVNDTNYTALNSEVIVGYTNLTAGRTVTLPVTGTLAGQVFIIKDEEGDATANNITVDVEGGANIDGAASATIAVDYGVLRVYFDGTNYFTW